MSSELAVVSSADSAGHNRLAAPSTLQGETMTSGDPGGPASQAAKIPAAPRSGWLRPSVIITGLFFLGLVIGGYAVSVIAGSDSASASAVNQLGQLAAA